jgi:hypothetical protein
MLISDFASIAAIGKPVDHKEWEKILQKHFDEGNYEYSHSMLSTSKEYYHKVYKGECKDIPYISFSISGVFIDGYIQDMGSIYRFSKLNKMIKAEIKKQKLAKYEL